jgi:hypothetical protein
MILGLVSLAIDAYDSYLYAKEFQHYSTMAMGRADALTQGEKGNMTLYNLTYAKSYMDGTFENTMCPDFMPRTDQWAMDNLNSMCMEPGTTATPAETADQE